MEPYWKSGTCGLRTFHALVGWEWASSYLKKCWYSPCSPNLSKTHMWNPPAPNTLRTTIGHQAHVACKRGWICWRHGHEHRHLQPCRCWFSNQWHVGNFLGHHVLTYRLIMFWCLETWHVYDTQYTHYLKLKDHELFTINIILAMPQPRRAGFQIILTVTGPHLISQLQSRVWSTNVVGRTWLVYRLRSGLMNHQLFYLESGDPHQLLKFKDLCSAFGNGLHRKRIDHVDSPSLYVWDAGEMHCTRYRALDLSQDPCSNRAAGLPCVNKRCAQKCFEGKLTLILQGCKMMHAAPNPIEILNMVPFQN